MLMIMGLPIHHTIHHTIPRQTFKLFGRSAFPNNGKSEVKVVKKESKSEAKMVTK
jgi:hypothetical protein